MSDHPAPPVIICHPRPGQNYGPGKEPQSVRDAWDAHLHNQSEAEHDREAEAS